MDEMIEEAQARSQIKGGDDHESESQVKGEGEDEGGL